MAVHLVLVSPTSALLKQVIALGDANSRFLGTYPFSAYERDAADGRIIAALDGGRELVGYLLYRVARGRAVIQHCCVGEAFRKGGVGRMLLADLKARTHSLFGIELHCAREFAATKFWEANGFVAFAGKEGRGAERRPLTRYVFDHRNADLFTTQLDSMSGDRLLVVVDTNVAYDWHEPSRPTAVESMALRADWLADEIDLRITDYAFSDADTCNDTSIRDRRKAFLTGLPKVNEDRGVAEQLVTKLAALLNLSSRRSLALDVRHIAAAAAAGADAFVTHDGELLSASDRIEEELGLAICSPARLIARLDEDLQSGKYQPIRLAGSAVFTRQLGAADIDPIARVFLSNAAGERIRRFASRIREVIADPQRCSLQVIEWPSGTPVGLLATDLRIIDRVTVPLMRFRESEVTGVLLRHSAALLVKVAASEGRALIDVTEGHRSTALEEALQGVGFARSGNVWRRFVPTGLRSRENLVSWFEPGLIKPSDWEDHDSVADASRALCRAAPADVIERALWPVKVAGEPLPAFIVPIQPRWAVHLFDEGLAMQTLRGGDPTLMFNTENVYYKSARQQVITAPGRVLWYVSDDGDSSGVGAIRACSPVLEVDTDTAKKLFAKHRRLGIYEWRDLMRSVGGDPHGQLTAIRFGVTECFKQSVPRESITEVLRGFGKPMPPLTTAYALPTGAFEEIYTLGSDTRHQ